MHPPPRKTSSFILLPNDKDHIMAKIKNKIFSSTSNFYDYFDNFCGLYYRVFWGGFCFFFAAFSLILGRIRGWRAFFLCQLPSLIFFSISFQKICTFPIFFGNFMEITRDGQKFKQIGLSLQ